MKPSPIIEARRFVIVDSDSVPEDVAGERIYWSDTSKSHDGKCIPLLVEENATRLRSEYISWTFEVANTKLKSGKTLLEELRLDGGSSLWWNTLLAEKSPRKCPAIYLVLQLRMLELLLSDLAEAEITLCSPNVSLHRILKDWCSQAGYRYRWVRTASTKVEKPTFRERFQALPHSVQALASAARKLWQRFQSGSAEVRTPAGHDKKQISLISYFPNIDLGAAREGRFRSSYWGALHDVLDVADFDRSWEKNWILFFSRNETHTYAEAVEFARKMNLRGTQGNFYILESFLSASALFRAIALYFRLRARALRIGPIRERFVFSGSRMCFWLALREDWRSSLIGFAAMESCLLRTIFREMARKLPRQEAGVYTYENQTWERALITGWKSQGHGRLIGFQHIFPQFLDTRMYDDPRSYSLTSDSVPRPDVLAVCGEGAVRAMREVSYPASEIRLVDALRFRYLSGKYGTARRDLRRAGLTLLVATSSVYEETRDMLRLLEKASWAKEFGRYGKVLIKGHPDQPVKGILQTLRFSVPYAESNTPLSLLWEEADVLFSANSTSVAIESSWIGKPTIVMGCRGSLNLNPLFRRSEVAFINSLEELVAALSEPQIPSVPPDFLHFTPQFSAWKSLLNANGPETTMR